MRAEDLLNPRRTAGGYHRSHRSLFPGVPWLVIACAVLGSAICALPAFAAFDQTHAIWTQELKKYASGGLVHYARWKRHQQGIDRYLDELAAIDPEEYKSFTENQKKALWINAYNAVAVKIVLDHYPIKGDKSYYPVNSMRQIPNVWEDYKFKVAGQEVNLYAIEHDIIRREFRDPRMHFVVVCASRGCPTMKPAAYVADTLEHDLDEATKMYLGDSKNVEWDPGKGEVRVSQLFRWFPLDFATAAGFTKMPFPPPTDEAIVLKYVLANAPAEVRKQFNESETRVVYKPFDWSLNDADEKPKAAAGKRSGAGKGNEKGAGRSAAGRQVCCGGPLEQ